MYAAIATVANATVVKPAVPQRANGKSGRQIAVIRRLRRGKRRTSCGREPIGTGTLPPA
jgi:hypothetical protein